MKYARNVDGIYRDPINIPQPWPDGFWTNDPVEFCEKMFPGTSGWELVADDFGDVHEPETVREAPSVRKTLVRIRASALSKAGQYAQSLALLKTIGE